MPAGMGARAAVYGACYGLFPIGWIVLNVIFMYDMNCASGRFKVLQERLMGITQDRRLQLLFLVFFLRRFFEGAAGVCASAAVAAALPIVFCLYPLSPAPLPVISTTPPLA